MANDSTKIMKKDDLVKHVAKRCGISQAIAKKTIDATFTYLAQQIVNKRVIPLQGIGTIKPAIKRGGTSFNISTQQKMEYGARRTVRFVINSNLKKKLPDLSPKELDLLEKTKVDYSKQ